MSFRERIAWVMAVILAVGTYFYIQKVVQTSARIGETMPPSFKYVLYYVTLIVITSVVGITAVSMNVGKEAERPPDEREKIILDKAGHWSGYVLAVGIVNGLLYFAYNADGNLFFHLAFGSLLVSSLSEYVLQIFLFRRGV